MQFASREQSSRRHNTTQNQDAIQEVIARSNNISDIDGTTNRVASVTLESDSLSADQPMSFRSKRRKKISKKDKMIEMDLEDHNNMKSSSVEDDNNNTMSKACKTKMDWEIPSTSLANAFSSDLTNNQSDVFSDYTDESTSDADADDEQSDWPDSSKPPFRSSTQLGGGHLLHPDFTTNCGGDSVLSSHVLKDVKDFLKDSTRKELFLDKVYRTSTIKQILRKESIPVQIVKKGRGTVALKKV